MALLGSCYPKINILTLKFFFHKNDLHHGGERSQRIENYLPVSVLLLYNKIWAVRKTYFQNTLKYGNNFDYKNHNQLHY
jgi:hypothetical protein